jgi:integrase
MNAAEHFTTAGVTTKRLMDLERCWGWWCKYARDRQLRPLPATEQALHVAAITRCVTGVPHDRTDEVLRVVRRAHLELGFDDPTGAAREFVAVHRRWSAQHLDADDPGAKGRTRPIALSEVDDICTYALTSASTSGFKSRWRYTRDGAAISVMYQQAVRGADISRVCIETLGRSRQGITLQRSATKNRPDGHARTLLVVHEPGCPPRCAACWLERWLDLLAELGATQGPLFPTDIVGLTMTNKGMDAPAITRRLRHLAALAGVETDTLRSRSTRRGAASAAAAAGASVSAVKDLLEHSAATNATVRYVEVDRDAVATKLRTLWTIN